MFYTYTAHMSSQGGDMLLSANLPTRCGDKAGFSSEEQCDFEQKYKKFAFNTSEEVKEGERIQDGDKANHEEKNRPARKYTSCETEVDLSVEGSNVSSHEGYCGARKRSLLEGIDLSTQQNYFETYIMEEPIFVPEPTLGKRRESHQPTTASSASNKKTKTSYSCQSSANCPSSIQVCDMNHRVGVARSSDGQDCQLCTSMYLNIRRFVEERGGKLLNTKLSPDLTIQCCEGHKWNVTYKRATKTWCKECKAKRKSIIKEMVAEENARMDAERQERQKRLLEESRRRMEAGEFRAREAQKAELDTFKVIYEEITRIASKFAREYCQKESEADFEQILLLYQTLIIPEQNLLSHLRSMNREQQRREYRRYTILLHPDKNPHPKANQAFQKALGLFSEFLHK